MLSMKWGVYDESVNFVGGTCDMQLCVLGWGKEGGILLAYTAQFKITEPSTVFHPCYTAISSCRDESKDLTIDLGTTRWCCLDGSGWIKM